MMAEGCLPCLRDLHQWCGSPLGADASCSITDLIGYIFVFVQHTNHVHVGYNTNNVVTLAAHNVISVTLCHLFLPDTARLWNNLPMKVVTAPSLESFKSGLHGCLVR